MRQAWDITEDMFLDEDEVEALLNHVVKVETDTVGERGENPRSWREAVTDRVIVEGLLFSGLRTTEFCRLRVDDVDTGTGKSKQPPAFHVVEGTREPRTVHVPGRVGSLIAGYLAEVRPQLLPEGETPATLIVNTRGRPYERTSLYRRVVRVLSAAGFAERASVQLLRHTYGYLAYRRTGGNLLFVQRQLGHAHPMVTAVYAKFADESYPNLADVVSGPTPTPNPKRGRR